jgi:lipoate-protein ligase A
MTWRFIDTDRIDGYYSAALFESIAKHAGSGEVDDTILFWRVRTPAVYLRYTSMWKMRYTRTTVQPTVSRWYGGCKEEGASRFT